MSRINRLHGTSGQRKWREKDGKKASIYASFVLYFLRAADASKYRQKRIGIKEALQKRVFSIKYAPMVELADTLVLGTSARAWGFKSLWAHQIKSCNQWLRGFFFSSGVNPGVQIISMSLAMLMGTEADSYANWSSADPVKSGGYSGTHRKHIILCIMCDMSLDLRWGI